MARALVDGSFGTEAFDSLVKTIQHLLVIPSGDEGLPKWMIVEEMVARAVTGKEGTQLSFDGVKEAVQQRIEMGKAKGGSASRQQEQLLELRKQNENLAKQYEDEKKKFADEKAKLENEVALLRKHVDKLKFLGPAVVDDSDKASLEEVGGQEPAIKEAKSAVQAIESDEVEESLKVSTFLLPPFFSCVLLFLPNHSLHWSSCWVTV